MSQQSNSNNDNNGSLENAEDIIERFGGIRPMASKMGIPVTTVQGWKKRNVIPENRVDEVVRAAHSNDIDLSDILEKGAANENGSSFGAAVEKARTQSTPAAEKKHEQAVRAAENTAASETAATPGQKQMPREEIMAKIKTAERRAIQKSTIATVLLVGLATIFGVMLLWPSREATMQNSKRITAIENKVQEHESLWGRLVPDDLQKQFGALKADAIALKEEANNLRTGINDLREKAQAFNDEVLAEDAGSLSQRLGALETQVASLTGSSEIVGLIRKIRTMQESAEGQLKIAESTMDLQKIMEAIQGNPAGLEGALSDAQKEDDALGQTLEGVSQTDLKAAAMLLGLAQFRTSLNRNAPFEEDLLLLNKLVGEDDPELSAAIAALAPQAKKGVLTPAGLSGQFKGLAGDIVVSSLKGEDVGLEEKAKARLNEVLQVKKDGELITGTDTQATVARAQQLLDEGDVPGALAELKTLEGEAATTAQPFVDQAEITLLAEQVQSMLTDKVAQKVKSSGSGALYTAQGIDVRTLVDGVRNIGLGHKVIGSKESGVMILPQESALPSFHMPEKHRAAPR